jgi:hypothetical protein
VSDPSNVTTAIIAAGSAVVGGVASGIFTLIALGVQHRHELEVDLQRHSRDAAKRLLQSNVAFDKAIAETSAQRMLTPEAIERFNQFAETLAIESVELRDPEVRNRLEIHMRLSNQMLGVIQMKRQSFDGIGLQLLETLRSHGIVMNRTLTAHVRQEELPPYQRFNVGSVKEILDWGAQAEKPR